MVKLKTITFFRVKFTLNKKLRGKKSIRPQVAPSLIIGDTAHLIILDRVPVICLIVDFNSDLESYRAPPLL